MKKNTQTWVDIRRMIAVCLAVILVATILPAPTEFAEETFLEEQQIQEPCELPEETEIQEIVEMPEEVEIQEIVEMPEEVQLQENNDNPEITETEHAEQFVSEDANLTCEAIEEYIEEPAVYDYCWQGMDDISFVSWILSADNTNYLYAVCTNEDITEKTALINRIEQIEEGSTRETVVNYISVISAPVTAVMTTNADNIGDETVNEQPETQTEESSLVENTETEDEKDGTEEDMSSENEQTEQLVEDVNDDMESIDVDQPSEEVISDTEEIGSEEKTDEDIVIPEEQPEEEMDHDENIEETAGEEKDYPWIGLSEEEFCNWILNGENDEYLLALYEKDESGNLSEEAVLFDNVINQLADTEKAAELQMYIEMLVNPPMRMMKAMKAASPEIEYITSRAEGIAYLEEHMVNRETFFKMYVKLPGDISQKEAQNIIREWSDTACGGYFDSYTGNGNTSDYLAYQMEGKCHPSVGVKSHNETETIIAADFSCSYYDTAAEEEQVRQSAASLLDSLGIWGMSSRKDKAWAIYSWISGNVSYGFCSDNPENHPYTAYGALIEHRAVCQGIACLTFKLFNDAGIPCRIMASSGHDWNIAQMDDGNWYIVDSTNGIVSAYGYFLLGTKTYSTWQTPKDNYTDMWNTVSVKDYDEVHMKETMQMSGLVGTNLKWELSDDYTTITFTPADPSKYSTLLITSDDSETFSQQTEQIRRFVADKLTTVVVQDISDYGMNEYWDPGHLPQIINSVWVQPVNYVLNGKFPTRPYIENAFLCFFGEKINITVPCTWTDENLHALGLSTYREQNAGLKKHNTFNPNITIIRSHNYQYDECTATCTEPGGAVLRCSVCKDVKETSVSVPALGHDYKEKSRTNATCKANGTVVSECSRCHDIKEETLTKLEHNWVETGVTPAACTKGGTKTYRCSLCKDTKSENIDPVGHVTGKTYVKQNPTCTQEGILATECSVCHEDIKQEPIKKIDHDYKEVSREESTCKKKGTVHYECTMCHDKQVEILEEKTHSWKETSRTPATCEKDGTIVYTCELCKDTKNETLPKTGHTPVPMEPTSTTTGGVQCSVCKKILEEPTQGIVVPVNAGSGETVYINGSPYTAGSDGNVTVPATTRNLTSACTYSYGSGSGGTYPTGMKVWILKQDGKTGKVEAIRDSSLDNLMTYSGTSIRLKGNQGIAIHTDINIGTWNSLVSGNYNGYSVQETGLLVTKTFENGIPTYNGSGVIKGLAYQRGGMNSMNKDGGRVYYMNTLVFGSDMEKTKWELACRPYMIVKDNGGNEIILYGGILNRSVRSVAQQIYPMYQNDKAIADFLKKILAA